MHSIVTTFRWAVIKVEVANFCAAMDTLIDQDDKHTDKQSENGPSWRGSSCFVHAAILPCSLVFHPVNHVMPLITSISVPCIIVANTQTKSKDKAIFPAVIKDVHSSKASS